MEISEGTSRGSRECADSSSELSIYLREKEALRLSVTSMDKNDVLSLAEDGDIASQEMAALRAAIERDFDEAVKWYSKAAEQGSVSAMCELGRMYKIGVGVSQDYKKAEKWFKKAAKQEHGQSLYELGRMYESGTGVPQDYARALDHFVGAAASGTSVSLFLHIGLYFEEGRGIGTPNLGEAEKWYRKAGDNAEALSRLERVKEKQGDTEAPHLYKDSAPCENKAATARLKTMQGSDLYDDRVDYNEGFMGDMESVPLKDNVEVGCSKGHYGENREDEGWIDSSRQNKDLLASIEDWYKSKEDMTGTSERNESGRNTRVVAIISSLLFLFFLCSCVVFFMMILILWA